MDSVLKLLEDGKRNFVFLGEAGSGKSEIAMNFAGYLLSLGQRPVHFFDMDMTKPLFRSRDLCRKLEQEGIIFHFEEQFMDAPTLVGGARELLRNRDCFVVMDVGGDHIGARSVGGIMASADRGTTVAYYVLNAFRPWSDSLEHIDGTLGRVLTAAHLTVEELHLIDNPNFGPSTGREDVLEGFRRMRQMVAPYKDIDFTCVREALYEDIKGELEGDVMPLVQNLKYPWDEEHDVGISDRINCLAG